MGKYWWEEEEEQQKQQSTQNTSQTSQGTQKKGYWWEDENTVSTAADQIVNRVDTWLKNHDNYITNYKNRFSGRKGSLEDDYVSDSGDWLKTVTQQKDNFKAEAESILSYMDQYKDYLNADFVRSVRDTLIAGTQQQRQIVTGATKDNEWWESFNDQNKYGKYGSAEEGYKSEQRKAGYQKTYEGMTSEEISDVIAKLDDGEERDWLTAYKPLVEYDEKSKLDTKALQSEIDAMEEAYKQAQSISLNMGMGGQDSDDSMKNQIRDVIGKVSNGKYYTMRDLKNAISQKKQQMTEAQEIQQLNSMNSVIGNADFNQKSQYVSTRTDVAMEDALWGMYRNQYDEGKLFGDYLYDYINKNEDALDVARVNNVASNASFLGLDQGYLQQMDDEELKVYNYYKKLDAEQGTDQANEYLRLLTGELNARRREQEQAFWSSYASESPVASSAFSILTSPLKSLTTISQVADYLKDGTVDQNAAYNKFSYIGSTIRNQVANDIVENSNNKKWGKVGSWTYQLGMSMGDFLMNTAVSGGNSALSLALMGSGAMADTVISAKDRGLNDDQAMILGVVAGAAEIVTEKFSLDALLNGDLSKGAVKYILTNAFTEGTEEVSSSVINLVADVLVSKEKSEWQMQIQEYLRKNPGATEQDAFNKVLGDTMLSLGLDFLGGALMGGVMGAGGAGINYVSNALPSNPDNIAAVEEYGGRTGELIQEGLESDAGTRSNKLAQKYQKQTESGKAMTGAQIRQLLAANQDQIKPKDLKLIQQAAQKRLTDLGQTENVEQIAELATKRATGQRLSKEEKSILARSKYGARVANELLPENIMSGDYTTEWTEDIGTKEVNAEAYNKKKIQQLREIIEQMKSTEDPATYKSLEERVGEDKTYAVAEDGNAAIIESDEVISLNNFAAKDITENDMTIELENGKEVKASGIEYESYDQSHLFSAVPKIENITPAAATVAIKGYDSSSGMSVSEYLNGFDEGFTYGYWGYSEADLQAGNFAPKLGDTLMKTAYEMGKEARKYSDETSDAPKVKMRTEADAKMTAEQKTAKQAERFVKGEAEVYFMDGESVTYFNNQKTGKIDSKRKAAVNTAKFLSKLGIGGKYYFYESYVNAAGKRVYKNANGVEKPAPNGFYKDAEGSIYIDLNAGDYGQGVALFTLGHELTHFVKAQSKKQFKILSDLVKEAFDKTDLSMHERVLAKQKFLQNSRAGESVSYDEAFEEVVADAMSTMMADGTFSEKLMEIKVKDKGLFDTIKRFFKNMIAKFTKAYEELTPDQRDARDIREMKDMFDKIQTAFAEALVEASDNYQASLSAVEAEAVDSLGENARVETNAEGEMVLASNESGNVQVFSERTYLEGGREKLEKALRQNGHTDAEINQTLSYVDDALDYIKILAAGYAKNMGYTKLSNHLIAEIVTNVKTGKQVMSSIVNNGDYPVNIDLSLICKKRVAYMNLMSRLITDGVFDKVNYDGAAIAEVNSILRENGFETACLGCFVESRRLQFQTWAETIVSEWNAEVEKRNPNAKEFGFAHGKMQELTDADIDALARELESVKKNDQGNVNLGQGNSVTRMGRLLDALPSLQKKLTVEDLLTPEGLTELRKHDGSLFSIVKSRYGAASPKIVQDFNPYASEIAMLTFAQVKDITNNAVKGAQAYVTEVSKEYGKLKRNRDETKADFDKRKKEHNQRIQDEAMRRYLYDIGGARIQSFSDFMIENVFDYIQIFADLSAKRLPLHGYTKEIVCLRLFGMTGAKWNGSLIAHVERSMGKELAGLLPAGTKDGIPVRVNGKDYVIGFDDYARNAATGGKSFIQSIGMKDIIALQLDPRYSPYVGNITIGVSDAQILAMLDSPLFRMVIPYHASGMLPQFAKLVGVDMYNDYTDYQNTTVRQYYDLDGNAVSELKNAKGDTVKADTSYAFNAEIQKTGDARTAANNYLNWCAQRHPVYDGSKLIGYATYNPKFSSSPYGTDFTRHENYYKLLEDFNTYDCNTEESTVQGAVTMNFPSEANRLTAQQMDAYKNAMRDTGIFSEKDIDKYAKKADMTFKEIIAAEVENRANYEASQMPKWEDTVKAVEDKLQKDYARPQKTSAETGTKNSDRASTGEKFSMRSAVEETADLVAFHNITPQLLMDVLNRKVLLMPSIAITNKGMIDFGEISLVFYKITIDPSANSENKLYGADAWTPTQTQLKKNAKFDTNKTVNAVNNLKNSIGSEYVPALFNITAKQFKEAIIRADGSIYDAFAHSIGMQTAYAMEKGIISEIPTTKSGKVNKTALHEQLNAELDTDNGWRQYKRWLNNISDTVITSYDKASNEDILRNMKAQPASAKTFKLSENGELVVPAAEYSSIEDMRKNKSRLSENAAEETKAVADEFLALAKEIGNNTKSVVNAINVAFADRYSTSNIVKSFESHGIKISTETAGKLQDMYKKAVELPTQYFEAKPQREVGLNEIAAVIMPKDEKLSELKSKLEELGISVTEYNADSKAERVKALNSVEKVKFSERDSTGKQLSNEQQSYFASSVVRDADGRLMVMYHGTANGGAFTVFDGNQLGNESRTSQIGQGFYFTNAKAEAKSYTKNVDIYGRISNGKNPYLHEVYLNITNPFNVAEDTLNLDDVKAVYADGTYDYFFNSWIPFYLDRKSVNGEVLTKAVVQAMSKEEKVSLYVDYLSKLGTKELLSNMVRAFPYGKQSELLAAMQNRMGYDGIVEEYAPGKYQYVAFSSEQIKSTDNKKPTADKDVRFSYRDEKPNAFNPDGKTLDEQLDNILDSAESFDGRYLYIGRFTPDFINMVKQYVDIKDLPIVMNYRDAYLSMENKENGRYQGDGINYHNLGKDGMKSAIESIGNPEQVLLSKKDGKIELVLEGIDYKGDKLLSIISLNTITRNAKKFIEAHIVTSIYGRRGIDKYIAKADREGRLIYSKKEEQVQGISQVQYEGNINTNSSFESNISRANTDVKKYSERGEGSSNRSLLANAFETISQNSKEYKQVQEYKAEIAVLNKLEAELHDLNQQIRDIMFSKGTRDNQKLKELEDRANRIAKGIAREDKKLLNMEASAPLRRVIEQERKKAAQKTKEHVKEIQQNKKVRAEQTELRHKIRKTVRDLDKILNRGNKQRNVKEDMRDFVSKALDIADYLFTDHISNDELIRRGITVRMTQKEAALVQETEEIIAKLDAATDINNPDMSLSDAQFAELDAKRKANEDKLRELLTAQRNERLSTPVYQLFDDLVNAYASLKNSNQEAVKAAYNEELEKSLRAFMSNDEQVKILKNMRVADMTTEELNWLLRAYTMVLTNVRKANEFFAKGMTESIDQVVTQIVNDFGRRKIPDKKLAIAAQKLSNKLGWSYEKLYYALDRIGSEAFTKLMMNLANSENIVMADIIEAEIYRDKIVEDYGFNDWDINKKIDREFLDNNGKKFTMTLGEMMSLYAYSRRKGAWDHIEYGGFVFGKAALTDPKPADSYKLTEKQCKAITDLLTENQKHYVEDMQKFLSETMGAKGNEVSMLLYGIKMFNESAYFPIHIAGDFMAKAEESQAKASEGFQSMSNAGFTHAQNPNAKAPFVLESFNEVWADHVNEMSRYHGTVPALEDIRRVMNRSSYSESNAESTSVKAIMKNHYGEDAVQYFNNLYKEANSGAINDKLQQTSKKMLSLFRKNAVAYSLSVIIQQPAAIVRAYAMIDRRYFGVKGIGAITSGIARAFTKEYINSYNEMLKYAPGVTMAKEIGGFDTATGGSIRSHLLDTKKSFKQKWKTETAKGKAGAVLDLVDDNPIANLPNVADKIAWIEIWNACKKETIAKHRDLSAGSEEFMKLVGERFTEVIRATQVYDSIFAKSPMLKSKNLAVQYLVSFMNEPNTTANMAESAVRDAMRGNWKQGLKKAQVVTHAIIFTGIMKSLIYAMRDDDEDETYIEKYIEAFAGSLMDDFNPLNYIPIARDAWSIAQGYDVERADMAIVSDAIGALTKVIDIASTSKEDMTEEQLIALDKKQTEANWKLVESIATCFGIPVKNIRREIMGVLNTAMNTIPYAGKNTGKSLSDKIMNTVIDSIPFMESKSKNDNLYDVILSGDMEYLERLKQTYKDENAYHSAVRKALRENDPRIREAALAGLSGDPSERVRIAKLIVADGFDVNDVALAINAEINALTEDDSSSGAAKTKGYYTTKDFVQEFANGDKSSANAVRDDVIQTAITNGKTQKEAEKDFASDVKSEAKETYLEGNLSDKAAKDILLAIGEDEEEVTDLVSYWSFCKAHKTSDLTQSQVEKYKEWAEPADIPLDVFEECMKRTAGIESIKDEWGDEVQSKMDQIIEIIDSLDLTWQQKDALFLAHEYAESSLKYVSW